MSWIGTGGSNPGDVSTNGIITGMGFNSGRTAYTENSPGSWYPVCKVSINARYGAGSADILLSIDGSSYESNTYGRAQLYLRVKQQNDMSGTLDFVQLISTHLSGLITGSDIVFVKTTDNGSLKEGTLYVRNNVPYTHINYTIINPAGVTVYASETAGGSLPSGTQYALTYGIYDNNIGSIGLGTTDPKGLLQLGNSYVVAPAPTGNAATDLANINAAIDAVANSISGYGGSWGVVYLQAGIYVINDKININSKNGIWIIGTGINTTTIQMNSATGKSLIELTDSSYFGIKNLSIHSYQSGNIHTGIKLGGVWHGVVENVEIIGMDTGILLTGSASTNGSANNAFREVRIWECNTGVQVGESGGTNWANGNIFYGGMVNDNVNYGVRFYNGYANVLYSVNIAGNDDNYGGVSFESSLGGNSIIGCHFEQNSGATASPILMASNHNRVICCYIGVPSGLAPIDWDSGSDGGNSGNVLYGNQITDAYPIEPRDITLGKLGVGTTAPNSGLHIAAGAGGTNPDKGYITMEELSANGTPASNGQMTVYAKGSKIVMAMKVGGTPRYTYIDMSATGNSWSQSTSTAP
jgi:hypothetical protein